MARTKGIIYAVIGIALPCFLALNETFSHVLLNSPKDVWVLQDTIGLAGPESQSESHIDPTKNLWEGVSCILSWLELSFFFGKLLFVSTNLGSQKVDTKSCPDARSSSFTLYPPPLPTPARYSLQLGGSCQKCQSKIRPLGDGLVISGPIIPT